MAITYRTEKGSPLTVEEIDGNFRELETRLNTLEEHGEGGEGFNLPPPQSSPSLPGYETASLPPTATMGQIAVLLSEESPTLIFFNGTNWQRLIKGDIL